MKYYFALLTIVLSLLSCNDDYTVGAKFWVINLTDSKVDSINIKSNNQTAKSKFISLKNNESKAYFLDMTDIPKIDGDYNLVFNDGDGKQHLKTFGYFTNGYPSEDSTIISIYSDTIIINQVLSKIMY
jgi:hypothetical protein